MPQGISQVSQPVCADIRSGPVLADYGWRLVNPATNYSDYAVQYVEPDVIQVGQTFVIYVREIINGSLVGIYRGTSSDGGSWSMSTTPVLTTGPNGTWDDSVVFSPNVVWNGTGYLMYYVGDGTNSFRQIGVAFSSNGINWTKSSLNPIITHGPNDYDARYTRGPSVLFDNGTYKMWYAGTSQQNFVTSIEYATSLDGARWTKYAGNPVFFGFNYSGPTYASRPNVVKVNGTFLMAFDDGGNDLAYATSSDGLSWRFSNSTNILLGLGGWHNNTVLSPRILVAGNHLLMWYEGGQALQNSTSHPAEGDGFASCGLAFIPLAKVITSTSISTSVSTSLVTKSYTTSFVTTSVSSLTQTVVQNPSASFFELASAFTGGIIVSLIGAVLFVMRLVRKKQ